MISTVYPIKRRDLYVLGLILIIASIMRFGESGISEFFHDDGMVSSLAQDMVAGVRFPLTGIISSVGIPNPPTSIYVMAVPFAISNDPMAAILFVMLLNVIGVGLLWLIAHRYFGRTVALVAGMAYALNPWAVMYSRKIWAQDYHTPFILLGIFLGLYGFLEIYDRHRVSAWGRLNRHQISQVLSLPVLLFGMQIHFAAWLLMPVYLMMVWAGRKNLTRITLILTIVMSILVMLPYGLGLSQTLTDDPTRITDAAGRSEAREGLRLASDALIDTLYLATGLGVETWVRPDNPQDVIDNVAPLAPFWVLLGLMVPIGLLRLTRSDLRMFVLLILLWAIVPTLAFTPVWTPVYPHYFIGSIPVLMLLIGLGVEWVAGMLPFRPTSRTILLSFVAVVLLTQGIWWRGLLRYLDVTEIAYPGFTTPIHYLNDIREELRDSDDVVVISHGMAWNLHHESVVWPVMLADNVRCIRTLQADGYAVFPQHPFTVVVAPDAPTGSVRDLYINDAVVEMPVRPGGGLYRLYDFEIAPNWPGEINPVEPVTFDGQVQLTGYQFDADRLILEWQLPDRNPDLNYQYSSKVLDADGNQIAQRDGVFWHGRHWCSGDRLVIWTDGMRLPDNAETLRIGLYTLGSAGDSQAYFNANVLDAMGNPAGQWVDIPLGND